MSFKKLFVSLVDALFFFVFFATVDLFDRFFFLSFEFDKSTEGKSYWIGLFHKYKKYDNVVVKPGYGAFGFFPLPKPKFSKKN